MKSMIIYSFAVFSAIGNVAGARMADAKHNLLSRQQQCLPEDHCISGKDLTTCDMCCSGQCKNEGVPGCGAVPGATAGPGCAGGSSPGTCLPAGSCISGKVLTTCSMCCSGTCAQQQQYGCGSAPGQLYGAACAGMPPSDTCLPAGHCISGKDLTTCSMCCSGICAQQQQYGCGSAPGQIYGAACA